MQNAATTNEVAAPVMVGSVPGAQATEPEALLQAGNAVLVRRFADMYYEDVFRYAYRLAGTAAEAEDLTQQAFLMALQRAHQLRDPSRARAWLFAVLRSCFLKVCRKRVPTPAANMELDIGMIPDDVSEMELDTEQLQNALDELSDEFRIVLVMFYFEQLSYREIASSLEIAQGTVMSRLARAKRQLRYKLISKGGTTGQIRERSRTS